MIRDPEHPVIPLNRQTPFLVRDGVLPDHYNRWADPLLLDRVAVGTVKTDQARHWICLYRSGSLMTAKVIASLDFAPLGRAFWGGRRLVGKKKPK
jgi:hypothetical protein